MKSAIEVRNLSWSYGEEKVLRGIDFQVEVGKFYSVIGPNGSGKTTLFKLISSALELKGGSIYLNERDAKTYTKKELAKTVATVPQNTAVEFDFSVEDIVMMGRSPYLRRFQSESEVDLEIVECAMKMVDIVHLREKKINGISGGERQRAIIARAIAQSADIMLLDEPISHIDLRYQIELLDTVRKLNREKGVTVVAILHDLNLAAEYSDKLFLISKGEIVAKGSPEEVLTASNIEEVYGLKVNLVENPETGKPHIIPLYSQF
ncbi:putative siderophore transport system ATP-binding protein YusV [Andreesenia angusta]|uniref:Putative siderophore transport system ATP-binding protein YusV n=1 Tax=Andreesenia angusta TaxID=39480 RepID=A0A1S1V722_9FIRM|nr:heme ABC transporter ATP-binding protein [Andreesenia angusta]OHW62342.1 putative siderophore transport system ATP-binding protein YusV [Andreesenia angusta]